MRTTSRGRRSPLRLAVVLTAVMLVSAGCGVLGLQEESQGSGGRTVITLAGPNQWNSNAKSFGPAWDELVAKFEKLEPDIDVRTTVLPLDSFMQTLSTQLSSGTAPELVFNQATHKPHMVHALDEELKKPNPYVEGNEHWIDVFPEDTFGYGVQKSLNQEGKLEYIPFNLVTTGLYYNKEIFDEVGITAPVETWEDFRAACAKLEDAGYDPVALDNQPLGVGWTLNSIWFQLGDKYTKAWNRYAPGGKPGTADQLTPKSQTRAITTGELSARTPEVVETLKLLKEFTDCSTPNWSGVQPSGATTNYRDFVSGKAAMTWGSVFAASALEADAEFDWGSMPFFDITTETTPLASGAPPRFGIQLGGTSYMIPSTVEGAKYDAALKFLQFMSSPNIQEWLNATGGIPAAEGLEPASAVASLMEGSWGEVAPVGDVMPISPPQADQPLQVVSGYLLGERGLDAQIKVTQDWMNKFVAYNVRDRGWENEPWAK